MADLQMSDLQITRRWVTS